MTIRPLVLAIAILAAPSAALAMGCSYGDHKQAQSCIEGTQWDSASQACVPVANT